MELTSTRKWIILLLSLTALFILILGGWWIYLASTLYIRLEALSSSGQVNWDVVSMLKWEGLTFFISTLSLLVTIIYLYIQDWKKAHGLQSFFASMTHELKTPLASISLQAQVLRDILLESEMQGETKEDLKKYNERIIADAKNLEKQIDNSLQLAKLEWSSKLKLSDINILEVVKRSSGSFPDLDFKFHIPSDLTVLADQLALDMILRNIFQNTRKHNKQNQKVVTVNALDNDDEVTIQFVDNGSPFEGEVSRLGRLFYKFNSPNGTGVGLYLIKKLMKKFKGSLEITHSNTLVFSLHFKKGRQA